MARMCILTGLVFPLFLIVLVRGSETKDRRVVKAQLHHFSYLTSSNYPNGHLLYENISWNIQCDPGYVVQLHVMEMDLHNSSLCGENRMTVNDTELTLLATMCNARSNGVDIYSSGSVMYVHFITGSSLGGKGFSLSYQAVWPFQARQRYTTTSPRYYSTSISSRGSGTEFSTIAIGILTAVGLLFVICCTVVVTCCCSRRYPSSSTGRPATSTSSTTRPTNNVRTVFVIPRRHTHPAISRPPVPPTAPPRQPAFSPYRVVHIVPRQHIHPAMSRPPVLPTAPPARAPADTNPALTPYSQGQHTHPAMSRPAVRPTASPASAPAYTNPAFSPYSEEPPPYCSLLQDRMS